MELHKYTVKCFKCGDTIILPILPEMQARAKEDWDLWERTAQAELARLEIWLSEASLFDLIKYWFNRK